MLTKHSSYSFLLLLLCQPLHADTLTDGTLGPRVQFNDSHFEIAESLGQRVGPNLFHSFERFNVPTNGRATFTGSVGIQNVLARVTGPNASDIDGTLRSEIPGANLYLMNPNGILFGPNASLNLSGSFHVTTADTIKLGTDGQFNARVPSHSVLTVAPPAAFGFFSQQPAAIKVEGHLKLQDRQQFSLVGGDLTLNQGVLYAPAGRINLISVASPLELNISNPKIDWLNTKLGNIIIKQEAISCLDSINCLEPHDDTKIADVIANVDASGKPGGGLIFIRGGSFTADGGVVYSTTRGNEPSQGIDMVINGPIQLHRGARISADSRDQGKGGQVNIITPYNLFISGYQDVSYRDGNYKRYDPSQSMVASNSFRAGAAGEVNIQAQQIDVDNGSIQAIAQIGSTGDAGNIHLQTKNLVLRNQGDITSTTYGTGKGGQIIATADEILIENMGRLGSPADISGSPETEDTPETGDAGDIHLDTKRLKITGGGVIDSNSWNNGEAGKIFIKATELISISGRNDHDGQRSMIGSTAYGGSKGGSIEIMTPVLDITEGIIHAVTSPNAIGIGGEIRLNVEEQFSLRNGGEITSESSGTDNGGSISITARDATLSNGKITASSVQTSGGNIFLSVANRLYLFNSTITAQAKGEKPGDKGGDLTISHPHLFIMDQYSKLSAQANAGHGGNIKIEANNFINPIPENIIASSEKSIDGTVTINAFQPNLAGMLTTPSRNYLRLGLLKRTRWCGQQNSDKTPTNSFIIRLQEMLEPSPSDLRFYSPVLGEE